MGEKRGGGGNGEKRQIIKGKVESEKLKKKEGKVQKWGEDPFFFFFFFFFFWLLTFQNDKNLFWVY